MSLADEIVKAKPAPMTEEVEGEGEDYAGGLSSAMEAFISAVKDGDATAAAEAFRTAAGICRDE